MERGAERHRRLRFAVARLRLALLDRWPGSIRSGADRPAVRGNPGRRVTVTMAVLAVLTVAGTGAYVLAARPRALSTGPAGSSGLTASTASTASSVSTGLTMGGVSSAVPGSSSASIGAMASAASSPPLVVDVVGRVRRPGVYRLAAGARVDDAVRAAGGLKPGTDAAMMNLARKLSDGEQIAVGVAGAGRPTGSTSGSESGSSNASSADPAGLDGPPTRIDLNSASETQLDSLPGVGPVLAQHILEWRTAHGGFNSVDQLRSVSGIGDAKFADLRGLVDVS
jgi:competence protein ComEA